MMTLSTWLKRQAKKFKSISTTPFLDAEVICCQALGLKREQLVVNNKQIIKPGNLTELNKLAKKREAGWPIAYLFKQKSFFGLDFFVDQRVLVPRPGSETMVEIGLKLLKKINKLNPMVVDLGVGSGCLLISLLNNFDKKILGYGLDISSSALKVAKINLKTYKLSKKIKLIKSDLLDNWPSQKQIDLLLANLPYLPNTYKKQEKKFGLKYEPKQALYSGADGLSAYRRLSKQIDKYKIKLLLIEVLPDQIKEAKKIFYKKNWRQRIIKDLGKQPRFLLLINSLRSN
jgi:release factor glutamine methyltransferase